MTEGGNPLRKKRILIFEPLSGGHRAEFIQYLFDYLATEDFRNDCEYIFVLAEDLCSAVCLVEGQRNVQVVSVGEAVSNLWKLCLEYVDRFKPTHLMLMELTPFELPLCFSRPSCRISSILFVQYPELRFGGWRERLKFVVKELKTVIFLRNPQLDRIFLLNGDVSCCYLNNRFKTDQYIPLPDPVPPGNPSPDFDLRAHYDLEAQTRVFLFFGSISARKGTDVLLEALALVSAETAKQSTFLLCGKPEQDYAGHFARRLARLKRSRPELRLVCDSRFFPNLGNESHIYAIGLDSNSLSAAGVFQWHSRPLCRCCDTGYCAGEWITWSLGQGK